MPPVFEGFDDFSLLGLASARDPFAALLPPGVIGASYVDYYTDTAMTTRATAIGDKIAAMKSFRPGDPPALQAVVTKRALLGRFPAGGVWQQLVNSHFEGAVSGTPGTAPTGWTSGDVATLTAPGDGTLAFSAAAGRRFLSLTVPFGATETRRWSVKCVANPNALKFSEMFWVPSAPVGTTVLYYANGASVVWGTYTPVAGDRLAIVISTTGTAGNMALRLGVGVVANTTGSVTLSEPQLVNGSAELPYQCSRAAHDITQVPLRDVIAPYFDGLDDFYTVSGLVPNSDEVFVLAGVQKVSDAALGMVLEYPANLNANAGFNVTSPDGPALPRFGAVSRGATSAQTVTTASTYAAPSAAVLAVESKISAPLLSIDINGVAGSPNTSSQGGGAFGSFDLYIGMRAGTSFPFKGFMVRPTFAFRLPSAANEARAARYLGALMGVSVA